MALRYAAINYEHREVDLKNKPIEMMVASPKGTVPVLVLPDRVIDESLEIMIWSLVQSDFEHWMSGSPDEMLALINHNDTVFKKHLDRYKYPNRFEAVDPIYHKEQAEQFLSLLENHLRKTRFLFSNQIQLADVAIFPFIRQFSFVEPKWFEAAPYPKLHLWLGYFLSSDLFLSVMHKHPIIEPK